MPIRFRCQDCRSRVKVPEGSQGKQVKCPRCGRIQSVPKHHANQSAANQPGHGVTVHTCVGSIHRAPKRKEALVGAGASTEQERFNAGGGSLGGGGLDIPEMDHPSEPVSQHDHQQTGYSNKHQRKMSRKQRRRQAALARQAQREREEMAAREEAVHEQDVIAESRKKIEDLFATSKHKDFSEQAEPGSTTDETVEVQPAAAPASPPRAIAFHGKAETQPEAKVAEQPEPAVETASAMTEPTPHPYETWSFDFTRDAYPFLRIIPWVLRVTALMLIGPAFKVMLVANDSGFSGVVSLLILLAGLSLVVVTWTVGEIANAVRDIALRKAAT